MKNPIVLGLLVVVVAVAVMMIIHGNPVGLWILGVLLGGAVGIALVLFYDSCVDALRTYFKHKR